MRKPSPELMEFIAVLVDNDDVIGPTREAPALMEPEDARQILRNAVLYAAIVLDLDVKKSDLPDSSGDSYNPKWKLWVDDDLNNQDAPERHTPEGFVGAISAQEAIDFVRIFGFENLEYMDLDHDLGLDEEGKPQDVKFFLKWLTETYPDGPVPEYKIHSRNPEGAAWIESYLNSWKKCCTAVVEEEVSSE